MCHYPTGASKWNPIEHRLFSEISKTWAGCPLRSFDKVVGYIQETRTQTGLQVTAHRVPTTYHTGGKVPKAVMAALAIQPHEVCPQWNDTIHPRPVNRSSCENAELILLRALAALAVISHNGLTCKTIQAHEVMAALQHGPDARNHRRGAPYCRREQVRRQA